MAGEFLFQGREIKILAGKVYLGGEKTEILRHIQASMVK